MVQIFKKKDWLEQIIGLSISLMIRMWVPKNWKDEGNGSLFPWMLGQQAQNSIVGVQKSTHVFFKF